MKLKKRLVLINRDFQLRYAAIAALVGFVTTALTLAVILVPLFQFKLLVIPRFLPMPILLLMSVTLVVNVGIILVFAVYLTHRIAGPMFSIGRFLRSIEEGRYSGQLRTRTSDDMQYLVRNLNGMLQGLRRRTEDDLRVIDGALSRLNSSQTTVDTEQAVADLQSLRQSLHARIQSGSVD